MATTLNLRNPCIITPLNENSIEKMLRGEYDNLEVNVYSLSRKKLYEIFSTGFFEHLNKKYGLQITDFEQEEIKNLEQIKLILNEDIKLFKDLRNISFWKNLERSLALAIAKKTAIIFYF